MYTYSQWMYTNSQWMYTHSQWIYDVVDSQMGSIELKKINLSIH